MNQYRILGNIIFFVSFMLVQIGCREERRMPASVYKYTAPIYSDIQLVAVGDTLTYALDDSTYTAIKSFNLFVHKGKEYICFYDQRSQTVNVYQFETQQFTGKISLKKWFKGSPLFRTSVYVKNFDSIYVANLDKLYLFNRKGGKRGSVDYLDKASAVFENESQPVFKGGKVFMLVRPGVDYTSLSALEKWKTIYEFDIANKAADLHYSLPELYQSNLFGSQYMEYNFCFNNRGRFVFSFPADTNIYETDLMDYHIGYNAKSHFQQGSIPPLSIDQFKGDTINKQYKLRDAYGPIFFDPYKKRYLRLAKQKLTEVAYAAKQPRKQTVIIFDESLRIIGESAFSNSLSFNSIIFSAVGNMYVRVNNADEQAIHFARLAYKEVPKDSLQQLTKLDTKIIK